MQEGKKQQYELAVWNGDDNSRTRALWEEVFTEDSQQFLEYYYRYKAPEAVVYVLLHGDTVISMLHLNPYLVSCHTKRERSYYIVGVATKMEYRHQGCMHRLLETALADISQESCPFVFLMPANPAIYAPFGFSYGYKHTEYRAKSEQIEACVKEAMLTGKSHDITVGDAQLYFETYRTDHAYMILLEQYAARVLEERYDYFCVHDRTYFIRLQKELQSENGDLFLIRKRNRKTQVLGSNGMDEVIGYFCYAKEERAYYQEVVVIKEAQELFVPVGEKEAIMFYEIQSMSKDARTYFPEIV